MDTADIVLIVMILVLLGAVIYILFFREDQFTRYASAGCRCGTGFIPNPHDDRCTLCRRFPDANTILPDDVKAKMAEERAKEGGDERP